LIRDTKIGTRHERQEKEAEMEGEAVIADDDDEGDEEEEDEGAEREREREEREEFGMAWLEATIEDIALDIDAVDDHVAEIDV
jgi:hypothetical protein